MIKKVRKIEIKTKGLSSQIFAGEYHSAFKGRGMEFSEVREYQYGDDVRNIDWNVTARLNRPYVKVFEEERELTVMLLVDVSGSGMFGTSVNMKRDVMTEVAAVLSFSAISNNDKIGVIFFSDKIEKFIPPQKGKKHILRIIRELLDFQSESNMTDLNEALSFLTNAIKKRCTAFVISDFRAPDFYDSLRIASKKHDVVALRVYDQVEKELPNIGFVKMYDAETGETRWIDTSIKNVRLSYKRWWDDLTNELNSTFTKCGVDMATISTNEDYVKPLIKLFEQR